MQHVNVKNTFTFTKDIHSLYPPKSEMRLQRKQPLPSKLKDEYRRTLFAQLNSRGLGILISPQQEVINQNLTDKVFLEQQQMISELQW